MPALDAQGRPTAGPPPGRPTRQGPPVPAPPDDDPLGSFDLSPATEEIGGADLPAPVGLDPIGPGDSGLDLPAPSGVPTATDSGLDLPAPVSLDDAGPGGLDLPAPVGPGGAPATRRQTLGRMPAAKGPGGPPPAPRKSPPPPPPGGKRPGGPSTLQNQAVPPPPGPPPLPNAGGPPPADFGLPSAEPPPAQQRNTLSFGQPPVPDSGVDLPAPADLDLPTPVNMDLPTPADMGVAPAELGVTPAEVGVAPADLDLTPQGGPSGSLSASELEDLDLPPMASAQAGAAASVAAGAAGSAAMPAGSSTLEPSPEASAAMSTWGTASPAPKDVPREIPKAVWYGLGGLVLIGAIGGGVYAAGILDPVPEPQGQEQQLVKRDPTEPAAERPEKVLKELLLDTATAYDRAAQMSEAISDKVGQAEALLLMDRRYGPDPVLVGQAHKLLEDYKSQPEPFVQRVVGLAALSAKDFATAAAVLVGDGDPRVRLYRGFMLLDQAKYPEALAEADAVLAAQPENRAALDLKTRLRLELEPDKAFEDLRKIAADNPDHVGLQLLLVEGLFRKGMLRDARTRVEGVKNEKAASKAFQAQLHALRGKLAAATGDRSAAITRFEEALKLAPDDADTRLTRIRTLIDGEEYTQARSEVEVWLRDSPGLVPLRLAQAELALQTGKGDEALGILGELSGKTADEAQVQFLVGQVQAMRMKVGDARKAFAAAKGDPRHTAEAAIAEAMMLEKAGQRDEAFKVLDESVGVLQEKAASMGVSRLHAAKARILSEAGEYSKAVSALDKAIQVAPSNNEAQLARGRTLLDDGDREGARRDLDAVYGRTGGFPGLAGPLGRLYLRSNEVDKLAELLGDKPDDPRATDEVLLVGARLRLAQEKVPEALSLVGKVLKRSPGSWEAHLVHAQVQVAAGEYGQALIAIQQSRPRDPNAEVELWNGKVLEYNGRPEEARGYYEKALQLDGGMTEARFLSGRLLAYSGAAREAANRLQSVVKETDAFPSAWVALGLAQRDLGRREDAIESFKKARTLDPGLGEAYYWEGRLSDDRNRHAATAAALRQAVKVAQEGESWVPHAYRLLGGALKELGKKGEARAALEKYLQIAPSGETGVGDVRRMLRDL